MRIHCLQICSFVNVIIYRCGLCDIIAPVFEQLSVKYSNAVFLKVDVDKCVATAAMQGVNGVPTFLFYRNQTKLGVYHESDPAGLESKIQQFYGSGESEDSESPVSGHVRSSDNVLLSYNWNDISCCSSVLTKSTNKKVVVTLFQWILTLS